MSNVTWILLHRPRQDRRHPRPPQLQPQALQPPALHPRGPSLPPRLRRAARALRAAPARRLGRRRRASGERRGDGQVAGGEGARAQGRAGVCVRCGWVWVWAGAGFRWHFDVCVHVGYDGNAQASSRFTFSLWCHYTGVHLDRLIETKLIRGLCGATHGKTFQHLLWQAKFEDKKIK